MRSTTFDMIGMTLMALWVMFTAGGLLVWGYVADSRPKPRPQPATDLSVEPAARVEPSPGVRAAAETQPGRTSQLPAARAEQSAPALADAGRH